MGTKKKVRMPRESKAGENLLELHGVQHDKNPRTSYSGESIPRENKISRRAGKEHAAGGRNGRKHKASEGHGRQAYNRTGAPPVIHPHDWMAYNPIPKRCTVSFQGQTEVDRSIFFEAIFDG